METYFFELILIVSLQIMLYLSCFFIGSNEPLQNCWKLLTKTKRAGARTIRTVIIILFFNQSRALSSPVIQ